jgi:hypothetical protein
MFDHRVEFISLMQTSSLQSAAKLSSSAFDKVQETVQKIGAEGWEIVSLSPMTTTAGSQTTHMVAAFKRPKGKA